MNFINIVLRTFVLYDILLKNEEGELDEKSNVSFIDIANSDKPVKVYNLDVIISVGYRVKSKEGTQFRIWANKILKDYMLKGYNINKRRLDYLEKTIKLIDIVNRIDEELENKDAKEVLKVIEETIALIR